jgi:predicted peptidase
MKPNLHFRQLLFMLLFAAPQLGTAANVADFSNFSLMSGSTTLLPGRLYIPPEATSNPSIARPLILFLHGSGENGTNNLSQINVNLDNLLAEAKLRGAYLYAPQTSSGWSSSTITDRVMTMIDRAVAEQTADDFRLYVTGLSSGGGGVWNMINRYSDRFAAAVPICAVSPSSDFVPSRLIDQATFAFQSRDDPNVPYATSRNVINSILTAARVSPPTYPPIGSPTIFEYFANGLDLNYVEFPTGGHNIWGRVYNSPPLYDWMFAHTTAVPEPGSAALVVLAVWFMAAVGRGRE